jgi:SNF2 family DNA or RNA helicase
MVRFTRPAVHRGGVLAEEMGLGKTIEARLAWLFVA